jgi:hypothetical protein
MIRSLILLVLCCVSCGCGYQLASSNPYYAKTIYVPFVDGDIDGDLTAAVIRQIASSNNLKYKECNTDLTLYVRILNDRSENIGFRYERNNEGMLTRTVIPTELRYSVLVEITVRDAFGCDVVGPVRISANTDLDHDYYFTEHGVNEFSLGQLTDIDGARDAMVVPLNRKLAEKIVDYVSNSL